MCCRSEVCDNNNPRNNEPWFCVKPPSKTCPTIVDLKRASGQAALFSPIVDFEQICFTFSCFKRLKLTANVGAKNEKNTKNSNLFDCRLLQFFDTNSSEIKGCINNSHWQPLNCKSPVVSLSSTHFCLKSKVVHFLGDSTIRQLFARITLDLQVNGPDNTLIWQQLQVAHDRPNQHYNTTLFYKAHGPPLYNPGPPNTRPYISNSINDIQGGKDVYVVFNVGVHTMHYNPFHYLRRLKGIRKAILMHHKHFAETKFIVRGMAVFEGEITHSSFQFFVYRQEIFLRETFSHLKNVFFLNYWDLTTVWVQDYIHPNVTTLEAEAVHMLRYICR